jgi:hypothetical protein
MSVLAGAKLHDVFHVDLLKPFKGEPPTETPPLLQFTMAAHALNPRQCCVAT